MKILLLSLVVLSGCDDPQPTVALPPLATDGLKSPPPATAGPEEADEEVLTLVVGGDVMLQDQINTIARQKGGEDLASGYAWFFEPLAPILSQFTDEGEVGFVVNLESPVATERNEPKSFPPTFNGPPEALIGLERAGVDVVTVANNHALDQGRGGLVETVDAAIGAGLLVTGGGHDAREAYAPVMLGKGPRVAVLAFYRRPGGRGEPDDGPVIAMLDERALVAVQEAKREADAVVVTVHWVGEFVSRPDDEWKNWARDLVGAGADAVICHGPHVVGPAEIVEVPDGRQALVAYSVGNLLSNMGWEVYPGKPLTPGKNSAQRPEAREEVLAVLQFRMGESSQRLTGFALVPMWLMDNRYTSYRKGAGPRLIYPQPLVDCELPEPFECFAASRPSECTALEQMISDGCDHIQQVLWQSGPTLISHPH